jgi:hypothetical protein
MTEEAPIPIDFVRRVTTAVPTSALEDYARHRLYFALRRFQDQVRSVTLRLNDENGPRRGVDSRCVASVELDRGPRIVVEATTAWPTASITAAAHRLNEILRRRADREVDRSRRAGARDRIAAALA